MLIRRTALALVMFLLLGSALPMAVQTAQVMKKQGDIAPAIGKSGMASSAHPLATKVGIEILSSGGNAFDAAVAMAAALNVVEPANSGMGGYGTILVYDAAKGKARFLNSSGRMPASLDSDSFRAPTANYKQNRTNAKAISTPGNVHAWEAMSKEYGKLKWSQLFEPAIKLADEGFVLSATGAGSIRGAFAGFPEHVKSFYGSGGKSLYAGDKLIQKDLAKSFRMIAEQGPNALYGGDIGKAIDAAMREAGSFLSLADLIADKAEWYEPISIDYRGCKIVTSPPPANSFDMLVRLGMMSRFDLPALGHNSTAYLHRYAEITKHGFWVRLKFASDPEVKPVPIEMLLSEDYWTDEVAKIDPKKAGIYTPPGKGSEDSHTTHFVVADQWGNIVCATQTLGNGFGSRIMPKGTGIWLNNSLAYCTFEPKGNPMDAFPGRHKLSGDCPTLILRDGKPWVAIGTPGGHTIGQTVPQMVMNLIDFKMDIQQAIAAPRISFAEPDTLTVENSIPESVRKELEAMGHKVRAGSKLGNAHGLTIEWDKEGRAVRFIGGADPRGEGSAAGY